MKKLYFRQIINEKSYCLSYIVGCPTVGECIVVDPQRDVSPYIQLSKKLGMKITMVMETHIHADHLSGSNLLSQETGAAIYMAQDSGVKFPYEELTDGETITVGNRRIMPLSTPGHTKESMSFLVDGRLLLTGDSLFVGDVGRMDLEGAGTIDQLYESIYRKILKFDDITEIYPAHFGASACGSGMENKTSSTIGFEKENNRILGNSDRNEFIKLIENTKLNEVPEFPDIRRRNIAGE